MKTKIRNRLSHLTLEALRGLLPLVVVGLLSSCDYNNSKALSEASRSPGESQGELGKTTVTFSEIRTKVLESRCVSCHAGYRNYATVAGEIGAIISAVESGRMPKRGPSLEPNLIALLRAWYLAGTPESVGETAPLPPQPDELRPNWQSLSAKVFFPKCVVCHNSNGEAKFLDLSSRQMFFEQRNREFFGDKLLDFEKPESSYLLQVITDIDEPMPPTSSGFNRLSEEEIKTLTKWIQLGLP